MNTNRLAACLTVIASCLLGACRSESTGTTGPEESVAVREWLEPVRSMVGVTGRSVLNCPTGDCILLHFPPAQVDDAGITASLTALSDPASEDVELCDEPNCRWCQTDAKHKDGSTFNCCTFAVGDIAGLTPDDWLAPDATGLTCYTVPMQVILDSYFTRIRIFRSPYDGIDTSRDIRNGDVLCLVDTQGPVPSYSHAGRISTVDGRHRLTSKFGAGPIVRTSIRAATRQYDGAFDELWVFRARRGQGH